MTTHEYCEHTDCTECGICEPDYHEQCEQQNEAEMKEAYDNNIAIKALEELRERLVWMENYTKKQDGMLAAVLAYRNAISTLDCEIEKHQTMAGYAEGRVVA